MVAAALLLGLLACQCAGVARGAFNEPVLFPLLEASGSAFGDLLAVGRFCGTGGGSGHGGAGLAVVLNTTRGDAFLMAGPTPHVVHCALEGLPWAKGARGLAAGDLDGDGTDEIVVLLASGGVSVVQVSHDAGQCTRQCSPAAARVMATAKPDSSAGAAAIAVLPHAPGSAPQLLAVAAADSSGPPFALLRYDAHAGTLRVTSRTDFGVAARPGWTWQHAAAGPGGLAAVTRVQKPTAAARSSQGSTVEVIILAAAGAGPGGFEFTRAVPTANKTMALEGKLLTTLVADLYGDGAPGLLLLERDTTLHYLFLPEADGGGAGAPLAHELITPPGGKVVTDSGRPWVAAAAGPWLASPGVLPAEQQLFGLRAPDHTEHFSVSIVVHGRPEHWMRRRASLANVRATQEFKATYNDSGRNVAGLTAPADVDRIKSILASTNANTFLWSVCDCEPDWRVPASWGCSRLNNYHDFVRLLDVTRGFSIGGEQLRMWLGLNPPTEARIPGGSSTTGDCNPPTDSPLTPFNETEIFAGGNYTSYDRWGILAGELAAWAPHLVALDIDDFSSNIGPGKIFTGTTVAQITSNMRARAPWLCLASVVCEC
jgi:hypothetical protein